MLRLLLSPLVLCIGMQTLSGEMPVKAPGEVAIPVGHRLELLNCDAKAIGSFFGRFSGKLVRPSSGAETLKINLTVSGPLSNADAARFIENQLLLEGYVLREDAPMEVTIVKGAGAWKMPAKDAKRAARVTGSPRPDAVAVPKGGMFDWINLDVNTAAHLYFKYTGRTVLVPSACAAIEIGIRREGPLTNAEAAALVEEALGAKGLFVKTFAPGEAAVFPINLTVIGEHGRNIPARPPRVRRVPTVRRVPSAP